MTVNLYGNKIKNVEVGMLTDHLCGNQKKEGQGVLTDNLCVIRKKGLKDSLWGMGRGCGHGPLPYLFSEVRL